MAVHRDSWQVVERTCLSVSWRWDDPLEIPSPCRQVLPTQAPSLPARLCLHPVSQACLSLSPSPDVRQVPLNSAQETPSQWLLPSEPAPLTACFIRHSEPLFQDARRSSRSRFQHSGLLLYTTATFLQDWAPPTHPQPSRTTHAPKQGVLLHTHTHTHSSCLLTPGNSYPSLNTRVDVPMHSLP